MNVANPEFTLLRHSCIDQQIKSIYNFSQFKQFFQLIMEKNVLCISTFPVCLVLILEKVNKPVYCIIKTIKINIYIFFCLGIKKKRWKSVRD